MDPQLSADRVRLQTWVEKRARDLLRIYEREAEIFTTTPDDPDVIRVYAWLPKERRKLEGPAIPHESIELDDGRKALTALMAFILLLPKRTDEENASVRDSDAG